MPATESGATPNIRLRCFHFHPKTSANFVAATKTPRIIGGRTEEKTAADRLETVGDYVAEFCLQLRELELEFFLRFFLELS